jgi:hypothetical protein
VDLARLYGDDTAGTPPSEHDERERLRAAAGADWPDVRDDPARLAALADCLRIADERAAGRRPSHYTTAATCAGCGPVWLWQGAPAHVLGCPWCLNRGAGLPVPPPPC